MSTLTVYPDPSSGATTVDGEVARLGAVSETWGTIRGGAGNFARTGGFGTGQCYAFYFVADGAGDWDSLLRYIATLDTSALTAGATISAATFSVKGNAKLDPASNTPNCNVYGSTPAANNDLANSDYGQIGTTAYCDTAITYANLSTSAYVDFAFNATGIAAISLTGITKLALKNANYDVANVEPVESTNETSWTIESADFTGTSSDPKLVITYTAGATYSMDADVGAFTLTSVATSLTKAMRMTADLGTFTFTGVAASLLKGVKITAALGTYILTGVSATLTRYGWTSETKNSSSYTNQAKNSTSMTNTAKSSAPSYTNRTKRS